MINFWRITLNNAHADLSPTLIFLREDVKLNDISLIFLVCMLSVPFPLFLFDILSKLSKLLKTNELINKGKLRIYTQIFTRNISQKRKFLCNVQNEFTIG